MWSRTAVKYVNESFSKIDLALQKNALRDGQYTFLLTLLQKDELSRKDVTVITTSLFIDGLSTVNMGIYIQLPFCIFDVNEKSIVQTVPVLMNNLYSLATNPHVQEKAYEEICNVSSDKTNLDASVLNKLTYLKAVIKETFRYA